LTVSEHKVKGAKRVQSVVITVSDTRDESTDESGMLIKDLLGEGGHEIVGYEIIKDEASEIRGVLQKTLKRDDIQFIVLNGGTGLAPRDVTYEVVNELLEKRLDGFGELFRFLSFQEIGPAAMLSRALAGSVKGKVVISLPGSKGAVELGMRQLILPELGHMVSQVQGK
jgi:molybdenum cofactor biosynthesis protein B